MTWRDRFAMIWPYTLPMIGLGAITTGVFHQWGTGPGLITTGTSLIVVEWQRRTDAAARGGE